MSGENPRCWHGCHASFADCFCRLSDGALVDRYRVGVVNDLAPKGTRQTNETMNRAYDALTGRLAGIRRENNALVEALQEMLPHLGCNCGDNQCFSDADIARLTALAASLPGPR